MTALTILYSLFEQQISALCTDFPPRSNTPFWWNAAVKLSEQRERMIENILLLLYIQCDRILTKQLAQYKY